MKEEMNLSDLWGGCIWSSSKPVTNYDRIISKSPEELARWIAKLYGCAHCPGFNVPCDNRCAEYWLDYLKQEVSE